MPAVVFSLWLSAGKLHTFTRYFDKHGQTTGDSL